ncbi:hypothetical protein A359_03690 [secondary endosymbiont of Ctenarytaina eucalypti]|uniref:Uncharacterized protein n=1 Tax=secondary endosymbiont of Ctenarytaina eucalypti TaxID=1199245 RepID=J3Z3F1_9ENTR|nr:hypothetical protein A359_03690 [secondary endosymbiont of Ctenarytaina eucalypti]
MLFAQSRRSCFMIRTSSIVYLSRKVTGLLAKSNVLYLSKIDYADLYIFRQRRCFRPDCKNSSY